jgi:3-oxoacyl-[acyl-carrier protein] reductase
MEVGLQGKIALVTGSSRGIGASIAEALAAQGANVMINYLNSAEKARELAERLNQTYKVECIAFQADVTKVEAIKRMAEHIVEEFGTIDIAVNNALHHYRFDPERRKLAWEMTWADYQDQLDGSLKSTYNVCSEVIPTMRKQGKGRIINLISNLVFRPVVPYHDYTTAKGAVLTYSRNLAADLGNSGITVNCVAPGLVYPTDASRMTKEDVKGMIIAQTPLGRIARPEDISGPVLFFASEWSRFVTGQTLAADGGFTML